MKKITLGIAIALLMGASYSMHAGPETGDGALTQVQGIIASVQGTVSDIKSGSNPTAIDAAFKDLEKTITEIK